MGRPKNQSWWLHCYNSGDYAKGLKVLETACDHLQGQISDDPKVETARLYIRQMSVDIFIVDAPLLILEPQDGGADSDIEGLHKAQLRYSIRMNYGEIPSVEVNTALKKCLQATLSEKTYVVPNEQLVPTRYCSVESNVFLHGREELTNEFYSTQKESHFLYK